MLISINGKIQDKDNATISVLDRGFLYGDSVYEVTYSQNRSLLYFKEHMDRLYNSASLLEMSFSFTRTYIEEQVIKLLKSYNHNRCYIRIIVTRGEGNISLASYESNNNLIIIVKEQPENPLTWYTEGVSVYLSSVIRNDRRSVDPNAKSGNYLNNVLAINEAKKHGYYDAIMLNSEGFLTEGTTFNIWFIKGDTIHTPHADCGILKGITRDKVIEIINRSDLNLEQGKFKTEEFLNAEAIFLTSSTKALVPITQVNDTHFQSVSNSNFQLLAKSYERYVKQDLSDNKSFQY